MVPSLDKQESLFFLQIKVVFSGVGRIVGRTGMGVGRSLPCQTCMGADHAETGARAIRSVEQSSEWPGYGKRL